jgi:hypothetical protein
MLRNWLALVLALGLLGPGATSAKPPDLPLDLDDHVASDPPAAEPALPEQRPHLLPSVRKQAALSVLFAAHPLMRLVPVDPVLDLPCDHPLPPAGECPVAEVPTPLEPGTVLQNLRNLIEGNGWVHAGEWMLATGKLPEAIECFEKAKNCCPGSPLAQRADAAILRVFARIYRQPATGTEEAEPRPAEVKPARPDVCPGYPCPKNNLPQSAPKPATGKPAGLSKVEVPPSLMKGDAEESEEPLWFLPWLDEWNVPANET